MKNSSTYSWFRNIALAEGTSFLVLLLIAMPLKYMANEPMANRIVGGIHGLLFVAFVIMAFEVKREFKKSWSWMAKAMLASIIPFGTFYMDKQWKREQQIPA